jgi:hypothetical protein
MKSWDDPVETTWSVRLDEGHEGFGRKGCSNSHARLLLLTIVREPSAAACEAPCARILQQ